MWQELFRGELAGLHKLNRSVETVEDVTESLGGIERLTDHIELTAGQIMLAAVLVNAVCLAVDDFNDCPSVVIQEDFRAV